MSGEMKPLFTATLTEQDQFVLSSELYKVPCFEELNECLAFNMYKHLEVDSSSALYKGLRTHISASAYVSAPVAKAVSFFQLYRLKDFAGAVSYVVSYVMNQLSGYDVQSACAIVFTEVNGEFKAKYFGNSAAKFAAFCYLNDNKKSVLEFLNQEKDK